jgi:hypothetical protein
MSAEHLYPATVPDWLAAWDAGDICWTVEMGGLGPGYEQCIHITAAEIMRHMLDANYSAAKWEKNPDVWKNDREAIEQFGRANREIKALGLSGAQWEAALNIAMAFYMRTPRAALLDPAIQRRLIQVRRYFPGSGS